MDYYFNKKKKRASSTPAEPQFLSVVVTPTEFNATIDITLDIDCSIVVVTSDGDLYFKTTVPLGPGVSVSADIVNDDNNPGEPLGDAIHYNYTITATETAAPHRVNTYSGSFNTIDALPTIGIVGVTPTYNGASCDFDTADAAIVSIETGVTLDYELGVTGIDDSYNTAHNAQSIAGNLDSSTTYYFKITVADESANRDTYASSFTTTSPPAPTIDDMQSNYLGTSHFNVHWSTDVDSDSFVTWGFAPGVYTDGSASDPGLTTDHNLEIFASLDQTIYYQVTSCNETGCTSAEASIEI